MNNNWITIIAIIVLCYLVLNKSKLIEPLTHVEVLPYDRFIIHPGGTSDLNMTWRGCTTHANQNLHPDVVRSLSDPTEPVKKWNCPKTPIRYIEIVNDRDKLVATLPAPPSQYRLCELETNIPAWIRPETFGDNALFYRCDHSINDPHYDPEYIGKVY